MTAIKANLIGPNRLPRWQLLSYAVLAAGIVTLAAVLYLIVAGIQEDTRQIRTEYRDNVPWYASQFERELSAFITALDAYHMGEPGATREHLVDRFDVFWSRIDNADQGPVGVLYMSFEGATELITEAKRVLWDIEPLVKSLESRDAVAHRLIKDSLSDLPAGFHKASLAALHEQNVQMAGLYNRVAEAHGMLLVIFAGVLAGSAILVGLILLDMRQINALRASLERRVAERTRDLRLEIAERRRAADALSESEQRFRDFANSASDWFWELGPDLRFLALSERFEQATGIPPEQVLGKSHHEVGRPDARDEVWIKHLEDVEAQRPFRDFRLVQLRPDGQTVFVSLSGTPRFDDMGRFLGYRGTGTNITEQVEVDRALRRSEERYRRLVDLSPDGILIHIENRIIFANPAAVRFLGAKSVDDLIGGSLLDLVDPQFHKITKWRVKEALERGREQPQMEQTFVALDGRSFPVHCASTRLSREEGRAILTVFRDIAQVKQMDPTLRQSP